MRASGYSLTLDYSRGSLKRQPMTRFNAPEVGVQ